MLSKQNEDKDTLWAKNFAWWKTGLKNTGEQ